MLNTISYRKKNQLLIAGIVLFLIIIYFFGIKKTITAYQQYQEVNEQMLVAANAPIMAAQLEKKLLVMDAKIGNSDTINDNKAQALLELTTNYCQQNKAVLREFPRTIAIEQGDLTIETNMFVIESDFTTLLKLVYTLEQKEKIGKIASVRYQLKKDFKTKEMALTATIYLQNVKKKAHV